jgi:hypothetical protein
MAKDTRDPAARFDGYLNPVVMAKVVEEADAAGRSLNDVVNERLARSYGLKPAAHPVPRGTPGRPRSRKPQPPA